MNHYIYHFSVYSRCKYKRYRVIVLSIVSRKLADDLKTAPTTCLTSKGGRRVNHWIMNVNSPRWGIYLPQPTSANILSNSNIYLSEPPLQYVLLDEMFIVAFPSCLLQLRSSCDDTHTHTHTHSIKWWSFCLRSSPTPLLKEHSQIFLFISGKYEHS